MHACIAEELLQAADQYMLEGLKRLCEAAISSALAVDTLAAVYETAENFNAPQVILLTARSPLSMNVC